MARYTEHASLPASVTAELALVHPVSDLSARGPLFANLTTTPRHVLACVDAHIRARRLLPKDHPLLNFPFLPLPVVTTIFTRLVDQAVRTLEEPSP